MKGLEEAFAPDKGVHDEDTAAVPSQLLSRLGSVGLVSVWLS